jgi:TonB-linked SusC/RagA family outer membrane protein
LVGNAVLAGECSHFTKYAVLVSIQKPKTEHMRKFATLVACFVLFAGQLLAQTDRTVTGTVTDEKGAPLTGVTVTALGSDRKVSATALTDGSGKFSIKVTSQARSLQFAYVGLEEQSVSISGKNSVSVKLSSASSNLSEVVVVGYGTQRKKDATGSAATVAGAAIAQKPIQSFEAGLAGRAAGVQITVPNGVLNTPPVFRIRGTNSISLSSYPLIVVDGVPTFTGDFSATSAAGNALASINPNDIESIDIAKDAAATAIYGSRAANGVVFITTKKGKSGKAKVTYDGWVGWTKAFRLPEVLDAFQYTDFKNNAVNNNPGQLTTLGANPFKLTNGPDGKPINTNWYDYIYRQGFQHSHNVNIQGGNDNTRYYFSLGYTKQEGIVQKNDFERKNMLFNIDSRLNKVASVGGKLSYSNEINTASASSGSLNGEAFNTAGLGRIALVNAPNVSPFNNDGSYNIAANNVVGSMSNNVPQVGFYNPAQILALNRSNSETNHMQANAYIELKPVSWITLRSLYGIDYINVDNEIFQNPFHGDGFSAAGNASSTYSKNKTYLWTNTLQADRTFGKHNINLLAGTEQQRRTGVGFGINRQTLSDPAYTVIQAGYTVNNPTGLGYGENYLLSAFGRLNYNFDRKYYLSGNIRQDEYSALGQKKGIFWGASAGYEISQEKFWSDAKLDKVLNSFKLRGSYGKVGNIGGIGDYSTFSTFGSGIYGGLATLAFSSAGNPNLKWETSKKLDFGFNASALNNRLSVEFAYFKNNIDELILNVSQAPSTGLGTVPANVGSMYNKGIELTISGTPIQKKDFSWTSQFNITTVKNEVTALDPTLPEIITSTSGLESVNRTKVGYPLGYLFVVRTGGVDPATGRRIFINSAGNNVLYQFVAPTGQFNYSNPDNTRYVGPGGATSISQGADGIYYQNSMPKIFGGFDNTFHYKDFDLNIQLTYQADFYVYYGTNAGLRDQRFWNNSTDMLRAWKKAGDVTDIPKSVYLDNVSNGSAIPLDVNVFKGDFIKLRGVTLSYNLPKNLLDRAKISSARFYISGQNLAVWTKYPGPDPEVSSNGNSTTGQGVDRNTISNARTITVGINVGF